MCNFLFSSTSPASCGTKLFQTSLDCKMGLPSLNFGSFHFIFKVKHLCLRPKKKKKVPKKNTIIFEMLDSAKILALLKCDNEV